MLVFFSFSCLLCLLALSVLLGCGGDRPSATTPSTVPAASSIGTPQPSPAVTPRSTIVPTAAATLVSSTVPPPTSVAAAQVPAPTLVATPTATPPPAVPVSPGELNFPNPSSPLLSAEPSRNQIDFEIGETTLWSDVIGKLSDEEESCIRDELGEERYQWVLERSAQQGVVMEMTTDKPWVEIWQVLLWGCLEQETADDLFWADTEHGAENLVDLLIAGLIGSTNEEAILSENCVRNLMASVDISRILAGELPGGSGYSRSSEGYDGGATYLYRGFLLCLQTNDDSSSGPLVEGEGYGLTSYSDIRWNDVLEQITKPESLCFRQAIGETYDSEIGEAIFDGQSKPWEVIPWGCLTRANAAYLFEVSDPRQEEFFNKGLLNLSGDNTECARDVLHRVDYAKSISSGLPGINSIQLAPLHGLLMALAYCQQDDLEGYKNYHKDRIAVVPLSPGVPASGTVDYRGDVDVFSYEVENGKVYRIDVEADSLQAPLAERTDSDFTFSDTYHTEAETGIRWPNTCYSTSESQEFPMEWRAESSGERQVIVRGGSCEDMGTYTIKLTASDN